MPDQSRNLHSTVKSPIAPALYRLFYQAYDFYYRISRSYWRYDFSFDSSHKSATVAQFSSISILQTQQVIAALGQTQDLTFCDIGCGKGRVLFVAAEFSFRRVIGLELFQDLVSVADQNLQKWNTATNLGSIAIYCSDATAYAYPAEPTVYYFFNPFPATIFAEVLNRIENSCQGHRTLLIIAHPVSNAYPDVLSTRPYRLIKTLDCSFSRSLIYEHISRAP